MTDLDTCLEELFDKDLNLNYEDFRDIMLEILNNERLTKHMMRSSSIALERFYNNSTLLEFTSSCVNVLALGIYLGRKQLMDFNVSDHMT